jgi:glutathione S-transferase
VRGKSTLSDVYQIFGGPGSPYSHKLRSVFRYRRIPHTWVVPQGGFSGGGSLGSDHDDVGKSDLAEAGKGVVPVVKYPSGEYKADSTPIIFDLESRHEGRSVIPLNRGLAFLCHLIEDMADEFLPIPMFHFRWTDDQVWCSRRQMFGWQGAISDEELDEKAQAFLDRQSGQLNRARSPGQRERMQKAYDGFLAAMEEQLRHGLFLFGTRPSLADFGIFGQLTQYAVDPTVCHQMKQTAVRTYQWTHLVDDLSGIEGDWFPPERVLTDPFLAFLRYTAEFYLPMAEGLVAGVGTDGLKDAANGARYRVKTFLSLKQELASLGAADRASIESALKHTGCWDGLQFKGDEAQKVVPIEPL